MCNGDEWADVTVELRERTAYGLPRLQTKRGSKVHVAVDTVRHLLALHVTPANEQERA
jgi:hypothetical protein